MCGDGIQSLKCLQNFKKALADAKKHFEELSAAFAERATELPHELAAGLQSLETAYQTVAPMRADAGYAVAELGAAGLQQTSDGLAALFQGRAQGLADFFCAEISALPTAVTDSLTASGQKVS